MRTIKLALARLLGFVLILALLPVVVRYAPPALAFVTGSNIPRVGIIAGHSGFDSGAICEDGLREVDITTRVAAEVAERLKKEGYKVEILQEFDPRLPGYVADVLVSLHVDSCIGYTGFKAARYRESAIPAEDNRLVACLYREYGRATGLPRHDQTITPDMTGYHALREKHPETPGAIIELGFLGGDRMRLVSADTPLAEGVAGAVECFISSG